MERYQRQTMLPEIGEAGQQRLSRARVLVVGAGGLSATLLPLLAGAGVGFIRLYDGDRVELHNLHRQTLFGVDDVGQQKVFCAQRALAQRNPDCHVEAHPYALSASQLPQALEGIDLVVDAADNFAMTYHLRRLLSGRPAADLRLGAGTQRLCWRILRRCAWLSRAVPAVAHGLG